MSKQTPVLFLYTRLPDYFYRCVQAFVRTYEGDVVIVRYRPDSNTKYSFPEDSHIHLYYKDELDLPAFIDDLNPSAIILSGWSDKQYTTVALKYRNKIPVALAMDNPWLATIRQKILCRISRWFIHSFCNCIWVTGWSQYEYARRLGFKKNSIYRELYCADTEKFYAGYQDGINFKKDNYPRTIVYVGRIVEYKQAHLLAKVFNEVVTTQKLGWKLLIAGKGPMKESIRQKKYAPVELLDFIDPADLPGFYKSAGIFCLPSTEEHWGVAVHEAAAAGLPLLLSDTVESGSQFLIEGFNGFSFKTGDEESFRSSLSKILNLDPEGLVTMGNNSILLSRRIDHATWTANLNSIINRYQ